MALQITGRHQEVPQEEKDYIAKKINRLDRHFDRIDEIAVTIDVERLHHVVEINLSAGTIHLFTKSSDTLLRAAVDRAIDKLETQVTKAKDKRSGNKKHSGRPITKTPEL